MKRICTVIGSRANYSSIKSAMRAIQGHPDLELQIVATASAVLDRYGQVVNLIERDGFAIDERLHILIEGETPATMAKSTGIGLIELPSVFERLKPDVVITAVSYTHLDVYKRQRRHIVGSVDRCCRR